MSNSLAETMAYVAQAIAGGISTLPQAGVAAQCKGR